jgi:hypothetical protein
MKPLYSVAIALFALSSLAAVAQEPTADSAGGQIPVTTTASPEIQELQKVEDSWSNAINNHDQYALELVLSPLFVDVSASGEVSTRDQQIADLINPANKADAVATLQQRVITVRQLGDISVANGTYTWTHKVNNVMMEEKGVFTHVFQRLHGNWVCVNAQRTAIHTETPRGKAKAKSQAELPFHIPLFSKGDKSKDQ